MFLRRSATSPGSRPGRPGEPRESSCNVNPLAQESYMRRMSHLWIVPLAWLAVMLTGIQQGLPG